MNTTKSKSRLVALVTVLVMAVSSLPVLSLAEVTRYISTGSGEDVNVHSSQELTSDNVSTSVPYSAQVTVLSNNGTWAYITWKGKTGYVLSRFLVTSEPKKKSEAATPTSTTKFVKTSNKGSLNLRSSKSTSSTKNIVGNIPYGTKISVLSTSGKWSYVKYGNTKGYVLSSLLSSKAPDAQSTSSTSTVSTKSTGTKYITSTNGKSVNFRSSASSKSRKNIITSLPVGTKVTTYGTTGKWTRIRYGSRYGYVMTTYLTKTKPKTPAKK